MASIKQKAMLNENVDPTIMITILKKRVAQLEEELNFYKADKDRGPIDGNERAL